MPTNSVSPVSGHGAGASLSPSLPPWVLPPPVPPTMPAISGVAAPLNIWHPTCSAPEGQRSCAPARRALRRRCAGRPLGADRRTALPRQAVPARSCAGFARSRGAAPPRAGGARPPLHALHDAPVPGRYMALGSLCAPDIPIRSGSKACRCAAPRHRRPRDTHTARRADGSGASSVLGPRKRD